LWHKQTIENDKSEKRFNRRGVFSGIDVGQNNLVLSNKLEREDSDTSSTAAAVTLVDSLPPRLLCSSNDGALLLCCCCCVKCQLLLT